MEEKKNILTYAGLKKLEDELHDLKVVKRKEVAGKIKEAREQGDLSENAEYDAAKDEQRDIEARIEELEKILGYHFENPELLEQAVTHISYANEVLGSAMRGNERLEFLGDAVLELVSSRWLYDHLAVPEGQLSRTRAALVCENSLCGQRADADTGSCDG